MVTYLDVASTTKPKQEVVDAIVPYLTEQWYNPSSLYSAGTKVKKDIDGARKIVADLINADSDEIFFTSGACEANSWVIRGFDDVVHCDKDRLIKMPEARSAIITTPIEHKSMIEAVSNPMLYSDVYFCNVDHNGIVDMNSLEGYLKQCENDTVLVSVIAANNETGIIQPLKEIADLVHKYDGIFHTDATQLLAHVPVNVNDIGIDLMSASAQKFGGIKGCGFLYKKKDIDLMPLIYGSQEGNQRGGTENVIGIIALGEAVKHIDYKSQARLSLIRDYFIEGLISIGCRLNGSKSNRLPNNINIMLPSGVSGESMLYMMDMSNVLLSTGSACNSHSVTPSYVLKSMGLSDEEAMRSIRITFSSDITKEEIDNVVNEMRKYIKLLRS